MLALASMPDSTTLAIVALAALGGSLAIWNIFAATINHAASLHDTRIRVAELQAKYLARASHIRGKEVIEVGEAEDDQAIEVG